MIARCPACSQHTTNVDEDTVGAMLCDACEKEIAQQDREDLALTAHPSVRLRLRWLLTRVRVGIQVKRQRRAAARRPAMLPYSVPQAYARLYQMEPQTADEADGAFRARVARTLDAWGQGISAREVLYNCRERVHGLVYGPLDDGYGEAHVTQIAHLVEAGFQAQLRRLHQRQKRQQFLRQLCFWRRRTTVSR